MKSFRFSRISFILFFIVLFFYLFEVNHFFRATTKTKFLTESEPQNTKWNHVNTNYHTDDTLLHVIISRFAVFQGQYPEQSFGKLNLFQTFCFPSFVNHRRTRHPLVWIILVGEHIHPFIRQQLKNMIEPHQDWIYVVYQDAFLLKEHNMPPPLKKLLNRKRRYYITTRFDIDDAVYPDMFFEIQKWASENVVDVPQDDPENPHRAAISFGRRSYLWHPEIYEYGVVSPYHFPSSGAGMSLLLPHPLTPFILNVHHSPHSHMEEFIRYEILTRKEFQNKILEDEYYQNHINHNPCTHQRCWGEPRPDEGMFIYVRSPTADGRRILKARSSHYDKVETAQILKRFHIDLDDAQESKNIQLEIRPRIEREQPIGIKKK
eukprot:gb/GECH01010276.1/.p1 GENE.gb/GECH01010276.1/~~gb/GECH01010276.1/.p1  ORF type:complete len:376 (+),score=46.49 gb/GECH01010276.1/:1-1128(+)